MFMLGQIHKYLFLLALLILFTFQMLIQIFIFLCMIFFSNFLYHLTLLKVIKDGSAKGD